MRRKLYVLSAKDLSGGSWNHGESWAIRSMGAPLTRRSSMAELSRLMGAAAGIALMMAIPGCKRPARPPPTAPASTATNISHPREDTAKAMREGIAKTNERIANGDPNPNLPYYRDPLERTLAYLETVKPPADVLPFPVLASIVPMADGRMALLVRWVESNFEVNGVRLTDDQGDLLVADDAFPPLTEKDKRGLRSTITRTRGIYLVEDRHEAGNDSAIPALKTFKLTRPLTPKGPSSPPPVNVRTRISARGSLPE
jgi:hypothetical protein